MTDNENTTQKTVQVKKSQLFKQFKRSMDQNLTGLDPLELQVWKHKDEVKEHYRSKGEFYPDGGPIACLGWKNLTSETRGFNWHHTKQDAINSCLEHGPCEWEEELSEENIETNFSVTNGELLETIWANRREEIDLSDFRHPEAESEYQKIEIEWEDDTTAEEFLKNNFSFYGEEK